MLKISSINAVIAAFAGIAFLITLFIQKVVRKMELRAKLDNTGKAPSLQKLYNQLEIVLRLEGIAFGFFVIFAIWP